MISRTRCLGDRIRSAVALRCWIFLFAAHASVHAGTFYFPHYGDGDGLAMTFVVSNNSDATATGELSVYNPAGELASLPFEDGTVSAVALALAPNSRVVLRTRGTSVPLRTGYVRVDLDQEEVTGVATFKFASGLEASAQASDTGKRFGMFVKRSSDFDTGIAVYRETLGPVRLKLHDTDGTLVDERPFDFAGSRGEDVQRARFLSELFPDLADVFQGSLIVESNGPFALLGFWSGGGLFSTIPVVPLKESSMDPFVAYWGSLNLQPETWWRESAPYSCYRMENAASPWRSAGLRDLGGSDPLSLIRYFGNGSYLRYGFMGFYGCTRPDKSPDSFNRDPPADPTYYSLGDQDIWVDLARVPSDAEGWWRDDGKRVDISMKAAVALLNQYVAPYFRRISEDNLRLTFHEGNEFQVEGEGKPGDSFNQQFQLVGACLNGCQHGSPGGLKRILLNDVASDTGGAAYAGWARFGLAAFRAEYMETIVHEIGHGWMAWPHSFSEVPRFGNDNVLLAPNPYSNHYDVMSGLDLRPLSVWDPELPGTLAINRYAAGWIKPEDVALHLVDDATYTLSKPREAGYQFLVVSSGRPYAFTTLEVLEERPSTLMPVNNDVYDPQGSDVGNYRPRRYDGVLVSRYDQTSGTGVYARVGPALYRKDNPNFLSEVNSGQDDYSLISDGETRDIGGGISVEVAKNQDGSYDVTVSGGRVAAFKAWCINRTFGYDTGCYLDEAVWEMD